MQLLTQSKEKLFSNSFDHASRESTHVVSSHSVNYSRFMFDFYIHIYLKFMSIMVINTAQNRVSMAVEEDRGMC